MLRKYISTTVVAFLLLSSSSAVSQDCASEKGLREAVRLGKTNVTNAGRLLHKTQGRFERTQVQAERAVSDAEILTDRCALTVERREASCNRNLVRLTERIEVQEQVLADAEFDLDACELFSLCAVIEKQIEKVTKKIERLTDRADDHELKCIERVESVEARCDERLLRLENLAFVKEDELADLEELLFEAEDLLLSSEEGLDEAQAEYDSCYGTGLF